MSVLVLASSSPYRAELLQRFGIKFDVAAPQIDESGHDNESFAMKAVRLSVEKAQAVALRQPGKVVIGSDQVASSQGIEYRKPGDFDTALQQLTALSGKVLTLSTGICVIDTRVAPVTHTALVDFDVELRDFSESEAAIYLRREKPFDCAAALKSEGLGICLIARFIGEDPTALVGLPLITLRELLERCGIRPLNCENNNLSERIEM